MALVAFITLSLVTGVTAAHGRDAFDATKNTPFSDDTTVSNNGSVSIYQNGSSIVLDTASNQTVRGNTTLDRGTKLEVQINAPQQFFMSNSATVQSDGTFNTSFNFSGYRPGTEFSVTVGHPRNNSTEIDALASTDGILQQSTKSAPSPPTTTTTTTTETRTSATMESSTSNTSVANRAINDTTDSATKTITSGQRTANDSGQPGFGIVVALVALVALGLVRRNG